MWDYTPHPPRPPKPGRTPKHPRPDPDESLRVRRPEDPLRWLEYVRLIHQRIAQSNLDSAEIKVLLVFINQALQEQKAPGSYLSEYEVGFVSKLERSPLARGLRGLHKRGLLTEPPDLPENSFYYALNGRHPWFEDQKGDILEAWGDDYEELRQYLIPDDPEKISAPKRAALERIYVPAALTEHTWLTVEQVAELCCVTVEFVNKHSTNAKLRKGNPTPEVLRCLRKNGKGEKRFEWPEVDRWRHAIFTSPRAKQDKAASQYPHRGNQRPTTDARREQAHAYFSNRHWSQKHR